MKAARPTGAPRVPSLFGKARGTRTIIVPPNGMMALGAFSGSLPYGAAPNYGSPSVEAWRSVVTENAGTLPIEFLMAWIAVESGGLPCDYETAAGFVEVGPFQLDPSNLAAGSTTQAIQQPSPPCPANAYSSSVQFSQLSSSQASAIVQGGIQYVSYCQAYAQTQLSSYGYTWDQTMADYWCMVKMVHVAPAMIPGLLQGAITALGGPTGTWDDCVANAVAVPASWTSNAQIVGQYGAGGGTGAALSSLASSILGDGASTTDLLVAAAVGVALWAALS